MNRNAGISLIAAILAALSLCIGISPIPFTGFICYPAAVILGVVALIVGLRAVVQIRSSREPGRELALLATGTGIVAAIGSLCITALGIMIWPQLLASLRQLLQPK